MAGTLKAKAVEVHVFLGTAMAKESAGLEWTPGAVYTVLILSRQPEGEVPDEALARKNASAAGWTGIKLERTKRLPVTAVPEGDVLRGAFQEALKEGSAIVAYRDPVKK